jgi:hypothetical protein
MWIPPCISSRLSEEEKEQLRRLREYENMYPDKQIQFDQTLDDERIPCEARNLPLAEKLAISHYKGLVMNEIDELEILALRVEFMGIIKDTDLYHYHGYTFFYIPLFDAVAGGSGYTEIFFFPSRFDAEEFPILEENKK